VRQCGLWMSGAAWPRRVVSVGLRHWRQHRQSPNSRRSLPGSWRPRAVAASVTRRQGTLRKVQQSSACRVTNRVSSTGRPLRFPRKSSPRGRLWICADASSARPRSTHGPPRGGGVASAATRADRRPIVTGSGARAMNAQWCRSRLPRSAGRRRGFSGRHHSPIGAHTVRNHSMSRLSSSSYRADLGRGNGRDN
jgi:hypothetical protein